MHAISPSYFKELKRFGTIITDYFGEMDIRDIRYKQTVEFTRATAIASHYSPKSQSNLLGCLHKMLTDAHDYGDIGSVPKFPKIEIPECDFQVIDLDVQDRIIDSISNPMDRAYILFTARQMIRPSETRALYWSDLDFKHGRVKIQRHFSLQEIKPTTKSKRIKILPLDGQVREALMKLPQHITCPFVFQKNGECYSESYARKLWNRSCLELGVKITFYQGTRHSSITEAVAREGYDDVQEFVGHTRRDMTKRYGKPNVDRLKKVLRNHD
jgi:integrase